MGPDEFDAAPAATGMAGALLGEVARLLHQLAGEGEGGVIDLQGLPMSDPDREALRERLGRGEVRVELEVAGSSEVWETRYAGVWWIRHRGGNGRVVAESIAVTPIPPIVVAHEADIVAASACLERELGEAACAKEPGDA